MANLKINTHHAFLNTQLVLTSDRPVYDIIDTTTGQKFVISDHKISFRLGKGKHILHSESLNENICIEVEDAIKLGGSRIKKAFVFDNTPWCFIIMGDRFYATNTNTKQEFVEYNICPEEIVSLKDEYVSSCPYFLFRTKNDYSIYNINEGTVITTFQNCIYANSHIIIYKEGQTHHIFNYRKGETIAEFDGQYLFGARFFFVKENHLYCLNLHTLSMNIVEGIAPLNNEYVLAENSLLVHIAEYERENRYIIYNLKLGKNIETLRLFIPYYIEYFYGKETTYHDKLKQYMKSYTEISKEFIHKIDFDLTPSTRFLDQIKSSYKTFHFHQIKKHGETNIMLGDLVTYTNDRTRSNINAEHSNRLLIMIESKDNLFDFRSATESDLNICFNYNEPSTKQNKNKSIPHALAESESGDKYITQEETGFMYHNNKTNESFTILNDLYDSSFYKNAYFSSDGKNVIFRKGSETGLLNLDYMVEKPFDIEGTTLSQNIGNNGYKPEIILDNFHLGLPIWRNPVTLKNVLQDDIDAKCYKSPDNKYIANINPKRIHHSVLEDKDISDEEFEELKKKYNYDRSDSEENKKHKAALRRDLVECFGREKFLF